MNTITFDKLRYAEKLQAGGISQEQAKVQADALDEALRETVATRYDVQDVKKEMKHDIELLSRDLTIKLYTVVGVATGIILAAIKLF